MVLWHIILAVLLLFPPSGWTAEEQIPQAQFRVNASSGQPSWYLAEKAIDGNLWSMWHTAWYGGGDPPHWYEIDLGKEYTLTRFVHYGRDDSNNNGRLGRALFLVGTTLPARTQVADVTFLPIRGPQDVRFAPVRARYIRMEIVTTVGRWASMAEFQVYHEPVSLPKFSLGLTIVGEGRVQSVGGELSCPAKCLHEFEQGTQVQLLATPAEGWMFDQWSGGVDCSSAVQMWASRVCTAIFKPVPPPPPPPPPPTYSLRVDVNGEGRVESMPAAVDCAGTCNYPFVKGSQITLIPVPDLGWQFSHWVGTSCALPFVINGDVSCTAEFRETAAKVYRVNVTVNGPGVVLSSPDDDILCPGVCTGEFLASTEIVLEPQPGANAVFVEWRGDTDCLDGKLNVTPTTPDIPVRNCEATFNLSGQVTIVLQGNVLSWDAYPNAENFYYYWRHADVPTYDRNKRIDMGLPSKVIVIAADGARGNTVCMVITVDVGGIESEFSNEVCVVGS